MTKRIQGQNRWPAFRTPVGVDMQEQRGAAALGALGSFCIPLLLALLLGGLNLFLGFLGLINEDFSELSAFALVLGLSAIVAIPCAFVGVASLLVAMRYGWAGWAMALGAGALLAAVVFTWIMPLKPGGLPVGVGFGAAYGLIFWFSARLTCPKAFIVTK